MPDDTHDNGAWAQFRGARPVTIRARLGGDERMSRHAAYRLPLDHPETARLEQLYHAGHLDGRLYANACAVWQLWAASGLGKSQGIATWLRTARTSGAGAGKSALFMAK